MHTAQPAGRQAHNHHRRASVLSLCYTRSIIYFYFFHFTHNDWCPTRCAREHGTAPSKSATTHNKIHSPLIWSQLFLCRNVDAIFSSTLSVPLWYSGCFVSHSRRSVVGRCRKFNCRWNNGQTHTSRARSFFRVDFSTRTLNSGNDTTVKRYFTPNSDI